MACGPLELLPDQFWRLTYYEFKLLVDGYRERMERQQYRDAWMLAHLLQPYTQERLTAEKILGKESVASRGQWTAISEEEYQALMQRKQQTRTGDDVQLPDWLR